MRRLKGSPGILVFLFYFICLWSETKCAPRKRPSQCPENCICHESNLTVNCKGLEVLPILLNPGLLQMRITHSDLKTINTLKSVYPNLTYCDLSHNKIDDLLSDLFVHKTKLKTLLLSGNNISSLNNNTFFGLEALEALYLDGNRLEVLSSGVFLPLRSLELLQLSRNLVRHVESNAFQPLSKLKTLFMNGNRLSTIPSEALGKFTNILRLDLGNNPLKSEIPNNSFMNLQTMYELSLGGCGINGLEPGAFKNLESLRKLWLDGNKFTTVPTDALQFVIRLEELNLSSNSFREIPSRAFRGLQYLKRIIVSECPELKVVRKHAFVDNILLEEVIFEHNRKMHRIEIGAFEGLDNVGYVSLRGCGFQTFDLQLLSWDELVGLDMSGNPVKCDCRLLWLRNLFKSTNVSKGVTCSSPQQLVGRRLVNLTDEDLQCDHVASKRQVVIGVAVSAAVIIALLATLGFRYRMAIAGVLKDRWSGNRKEPQYQKTNSEEESTILHAAQQSLKMTPVTEL